MLVERSAPTWLRLSPPETDLETSVTASCIAAGITQVEAETQQLRASAQQIPEHKAAELRKSSASQATKPPRLALIQVLVNEEDVARAGEGVHNLQRCWGALLSGDGQGVNEEKAKAPQLFEGL